MPVTQGKDKKWFCSIPSISELQLTTLLATDETPLVRGRPPNTEVPVPASAMGLLSEFSPEPPKDFPVGGGKL